MLILIETAGCTDQNLLLYMTSVIPPQNFSLLTLKLDIGLPLPENPHACSYEVVMKEPLVFTPLPTIIVQEMVKTLMVSRQHCIRLNPDIISCCCISRVDSSLDCDPTVRIIFLHA